MAKKHGVLRCEDGTYEFYWLGNRISLEEFNEQTHRLAIDLCSEINGIAMGMEMAVNFDESKLALARLDVLKELLLLPLCHPCRLLIG